MTLFSRWVVNLKNHMWGSRQARGAPLRPPFGASRLTPASAPPLGPGGVPRRDFQYCPAIDKNVQLSAKRPSYQPNPRYQPKKRRYLYNIEPRKIGIFQLSHDRTNFVQSAIIEEFRHQLLRLTLYQLGHNGKRFFSFP